MTTSRKDVPVAIHSEAQLLGSIMFDRSNLNEVQEIVRPEDFSDPQFRAIYAAVLALAAENAPLDARSIAAHCDKAGGDVTAALVAIEQGLSMDMSPAWHAGEVVEAANLRAIIEKCEQTIVLARARRGSSVVSGGLLDSLLTIRSRERFRPARTPQEALAGHVAWVRERAQARREGKVVSHDTYLPAVDSILGGLNVGEYTVLAAGSSIGKSTFLVNIALNNLERGVPVLIYTVEMSADVLRAKLMQMLDPSLWVNKQVRGTMSDADLAALERVVARIAGYPLVIEEGRCSPSSVRAAIIRARLHYPDLQFVMVDGIYVMEPDAGARTDSRMSELAGMSRSLKYMSHTRDLGVHLITTHQFTKQQEYRGTKREIESGAGAEPVLSDLRECGTIKDDADVVMFLHRDRVDAEGKQPDMIPTKVLIRKNRNHRIGNAMVQFHVNRQRFA